MAASYNGADKRIKYLFDNGGGGGGGSANIWTGTLAEYIAQASQIADGTQINLTDDEIMTPIVGSYNIYSTQEKQIGVWKNGKPLYQITISKTISLGSNVTAISTTDIPDLENIIDYWGFIGDSFPLNYYNSADYRTYSYLSGNSIIVYGKSGTTASQNLTITVQYTKSTDVAGSGLFVPSGAMAQHYTSDEQIIGTWMGQTLYQKSQEGGITFTTAGVWSDTNITGVNKPISVDCTILRDGEPIPLGYFTSAIRGVWVCRDNTIKVRMDAMIAGETYTLGSITAKYIK